MAPSRKNRGEIKTCAPPAEDLTPWKLPTDLLLEIIARSNPRTLVRCAATCRLLRRRILKQPYFQQAAPCILVYLWNDARQPISLVHPTILDGGVLHWLPCHGREILSFDLGAGKPGSLNLPPTNCNVNQLYLATSPDRKLLKLLAVRGFTMSVWLQLPAPATGGCGWSLQTVIDMEEKLRSLDPNITGGPGERIEFEGSGKSNGEVVFLVARGYNHIGDAVIVFDLETNKMQKKQLGLSLLEIDMSSRLQVMKKFHNKLAK